MTKAAKRRAREPEVSAAPPAGAQRWAVMAICGLLLLGVAGGIALIGGWRRLLLFLRLKASKGPGTVPDLLDPAAKAAFDRVRDDLKSIRDRLGNPLYAASKAGPWGLLLPGVGVLLVLTGWSAIVTPVGFEPRWLQIFFETPR